MVQAVLVFGFKLWVMLKEMGSTDQGKRVQKKPDSILVTPAEDEALGEAGILSSATYIGLI